MTQAPSQSTSTGHTRAQLAPRMLASRIVIAEPRRLPEAIFLMKRGTSMWVGQAPAHGASKQYRQRLASTRASWVLKAGWRSGNLCSISGFVGLVMSFRTAAIAAQTDCQSVLHSLRRTLWLRTRSGWLLSAAGIHRHRRG